MSDIFTAAQEAEIDRRAAATAASMIAKVLTGSHDRVLAAVRGAPVLVPIFHLDDIARLTAAPSPGKVDHNSKEFLV